MQTRQGAKGLWVLLAAVILGAGQQVIGQQVEPWATMKGHAERVNSLAFSPDGRVLASAGHDGTVRLWEVLTGKERATLQRHHGVPIWAVAYSPNGKFLASGGHDEVVRVWDAAGRPSSPPKNQLGYSLSFSPEGTILAVGGAKGLAGDLRLWDLRANKERFAFRGNFGFVQSISFSADGRMLVSGDTDGAITLWEVASGEVRASLRGHRGYVLSVAFVPDTGLLASGGSDGTVRVWDLRAGKQRATLWGSGGRINCVVGARKLLASAGRDCTVRLWDTITGEQLLALKLEEPVWSVAFNPDGKLLAAGDYRGTIRLWSVPKLLAHKGKKPEPRPGLKGMR